MASPEGADWIEFPHCNSIAVAFFDNTCFLAITVFTGSARIVSRTGGRPRRSFGRGLWGTIALVAARGRWGDVGRPCFFQTPRPI